MIKHAYPDEYEQKLESHLELLEMELTLKKAEMEKVREEGERSKDAIAALENVNEKLNHALEKKTKELDKHLLSLGGTGEMGGISKSIASASSIYGGMSSKAKKEVKKTIDRASNHLDQLKDESTEFGDLSSICVNPGDHREMMIGDLSNISFKPDKKMRGERQFDL